MDREILHLLFVILSSSLGLLSVLTAAIIGAILMVVMGWLQKYFQKLLVSHSSLICKIIYVAIRDESDNDRFFQIFVK